MKEITVYKRGDQLPERRRGRGNAEISTITQRTENREQFVEGVQKALSPKTREAYDYQWAQFAAWCQTNGLPALPTHEDAVAEYFGYLSRPVEFTDTLGRKRKRDGCSKATYMLIRSAIMNKHGELPAYVEEASGNLVPRPKLKLNGDLFARYIKGNERTRHESGKVANKATPFLVADFFELRDLIGNSNDIYDIRDLALLGLGIVRALRGPSELAALNYAERGSTGCRGIIHIRSHGAVIQMHTTKTNQTGGKEDPRHIEEGPALDAVRSWVRAAGIEKGSPLFRPIKYIPGSQDTVILAKRMAGRTLHDVVRRRARQLLKHRAPDMTDEELDAAVAEYSTHSLRRGALTSLARAGATLTEMMELSRHSKKSAGVVLEYIEEQNEGARAISKLGM